MPTLWGNHQPNNDDGNGRADDGREAADERTRLLSNHADRGPAMLAPDDPAVSPFNLWTVRMFKHVTVFFTLITAGWWTVLLISTFVTPPGLHMRGSGFFAFANTTIALLALILDLMFFGTPSKSTRILCACMALALLVNTILTLAVQMVRYEEGWVGAVSVSWVLLMSLWVLAADRTVEWGKAEEEERLTGRSETRRTLGEWSRVLTSTVGFFVLCLAVFLMTLTLIVRDKYRMHVFCEANITDGRDRDLPTVLLESGEFPVQSGLAQLAANALRNGTIARYCYVDRPGYAWSDTAPSPFSAGMGAVAVSEALAKAGEPGPWVVVSAGVGGFYSRIFASQHGNEVKGLLLVDALHDDDLDRLASAHRGLLFWLWGILSRWGSTRYRAPCLRGATARTASGASRPSITPNTCSRDCRRRSWPARSQARGAQQPQHHAQGYGAGGDFVGDRIKGNRRWEEKQRDLSRLTTNLKHWDVVDGAPHEVWRTLEGRERIERRMGELVRGY
ncbi:unnamed protein product [Parascedosporium putredinis]|uniref:Mitochondrial integral membrane protein n=1 Tax=Parascedosporium putredinis TaxID=1442378 RepID=A0A9P1H7K6_9PEZI|nr:unnamed protein product [Parascedosporium putredinis]CAI7998584.1 unnamed protein product [Parascedosporium putredinis]